MRGHHAFLSSLTPFQRQIWPCCSSRPRAGGMELSSAPRGCTPTCWGDARLLGQRQGPGRSHPTPPVRAPSVPPQQRALPANKSRRRPGQDRQPRCRDLPGALPFPVPVPRPAQPCSGRPGEQSPPDPAPQEGRDAHTCPSLISRAAFGVTPVFRKLLFWKSCRSAAFCSVFPIPASRRFSGTPWAFSEMSNPRRSPQHLQCFVSALAKC